MQTQNTKSKGEAKREDEQYGKPNEQCQKHQKLIADETKTKEKEKENLVDKTAEDENHKNTSKTNKPGTKHFKFHPENLQAKKIEDKLKEEEQMENDDREKTLEKPNLKT